MNGNRRDAERLGYDSGAVSGISTALNTMTYATCAEQTMLVVVCAINLGAVSRRLSKGGGAPVSHRAIVGRVGLLLVTLVGLVGWSSVPALASLPNTSNPTLHLDRTMRTTPFVGTSVSMRDGEGSAFVPRDNSLWLAGDNGRSIFEINPATGVLKREITRTAFESATKFGGGPVAGPNRDPDMESMSYDDVNDILYVFSGNCCNSTVLPTVFRLMRDGGGQFQVESYQALPTSSDFTASAWNRGDSTVGDSTVWVGKGRDIRTYNYVTNGLGPIVHVSNLTGILGLGFSDDGADLFAVTNKQRLVRVNWATRTIVPGWNFDLRPSGVRDSRAVDLIGDQFYVLDGYDGRSSGDPLKYAVFVYSIIGPAPTAPTAHFTASPTSGNAPLTVSFTDTSTGDPTPSPSWDFGDGVGTSTSSTPTYTYTSPGPYTVILTATNTAGSDTEQATITVGEPPPPPTNLVLNPGFDGGTSGWGTGTSGTGVSVERVTPGRDGTGGAARLVNGATVNRRCVLNDSPNWVTTTQAGVYTASIWVKAETAGGLFRLVLKEFNGSTEIGSKSVERTLTTDWQLFTVSITPTSPGTSTLDLWGLMPEAYAPPGTCFLADDISLSKS
jgi:PKD repeat protein